MNDVAVNNYREKFEEVMRSKGFTDEDLEYFCLTEEEETTHPLRGRFLNYKNTETNLQFSLFVAGAKLEAERLEWLFKNGIDFVTKRLTFDKHVSIINFRQAIDEKINQNKESQNVIE